ncbi:MAG: hypothetical protein JST12_19970 [Armatimonadetes bacterium]|nr:hypothetical protein [Armatimonadota bacterium]MBS1703952.1 hypothetical protein [Armatimonadota bacterium]
MKAKNVQLTVAFALLGIVLVALLMPKHRQLDPRWNQYATFLREADTVQTVATTFDFFPFDNPPTNIEKYLSEKEPGGRHKVQICDAKMRERILSCIAQITTQQDMASSCFCPHHFVIATKGSQRVVLSICFFCQSCLTGGSIQVQDSISKSGIHDTAEAFGIDLASDLGDKRCFINDGVSGKLPE